MQLGVQRSKPCKKRFETRVVLYMGKAIVSVFIFTIVLSIANPVLAHHRTSRYYSYNWSPNVTVTSSVPRASSTTPTQTTTTPTPAPLATEFAAAVEQYVIQYTNDEREKNGLTPLSADSKLASIARAHSLDMLANNYFSHTNASGCGAGCRLNAAGYAWMSYGENIYWMSGYNLNAAETAKKIVDGWMNSAGHRANILNGKFTKLGMGIASQGSKVYATADYAVPR